MRIRDIIRNDDGRSELDPSLEAMILPIIPAVLEARRVGGENLAVRALEQNARRVAKRLATADPALADAVAAGRVMIVAAVKQMHSGEVKFLETRSSAGPAAAPASRQPEHA